MTHDDNIERVLERWFTEGPRHMSDRLFDGTLERIERLPKHRLADLSMRLSAMKLNLRIVVATALLVAVAGLGLAVLNRVPGVGTPPSPGPTATNGPTMLPSAISAAIQTKWTSVGERPNFGILSSRSRYDLIVGATTVRLNEFKGEVINTWSAGPAGGIVVRVPFPESVVKGMGWKECHAGDEGTYQVDLSPDGATLTLTLASDPCQNRAGIMAGEWKRWPCLNPESVCGPELIPGRHLASAFTPTTGQRFAYTVPAGWSTVVDTDFDFWLGRPNDPGTMAISVYLDVAAHSQASDCLDEHEPGVGTTAPEIAAWLATLPNVVATAPTPITISGYTGMQLDLSVAPGWTYTCAQYPDAPGLVLTLADLVTLPQEEGVYVRATLEGTAHSRYILLDLGPDHTMFIEVSGPDEARWSEMVAAAMPVIEAFEIGR